MKVDLWKLHTDRNKLYLLTIDNDSKKAILDQGRLIYIDFGMVKVIFKGDGEDINKPKKHQQKYSN